MELYVEKEVTGQYGLIDTFINETVTLNTKTTYLQDITAVFKGFTNDFSVQATPNNIKLLTYFGYADQLQPSNIQKRAKLYLDGNLYKEGIITLRESSWINSSPSLFSMEFSDGKKNLTETLGEDTLSMLEGGEIVWNAKNIQAGLQGIQTGSTNARWFIPLVSTQRIFSLDSRPEALLTDNIAYQVGKPITSENVLLSSEIRPAVFIADILTAINTKYDIKIDPTPYTNGTTQLTDLCVMCNSANVAVNEAKANINVNQWGRDSFREERFDILIRNDINGFELNYLGYGAGAAHEATFDMIIQLSKDTFGTEVNKNFIYSTEVWELFLDGKKKKKLSYSISGGSESNSDHLRIRIGLDVFTPEGGNAPSALIKPLIGIFVSADNLAEWRFTTVRFNWHDEGWEKVSFFNSQPATQPTTVSLFKSLPEMKLIDFVKSVYTMFGYKKFGDSVLNEFYYTNKNVGQAVRKINDLTPYADLSRLTKKVNTKYDGYNLKHATSEYQQNVAFEIANGMEYGQLKYPLTGKPKTEFKIETKFTAPVFNPVATDADDTVLTFYPFGSEAKLNDLETRFIYDTITKEFPIFYYNGVTNISTPYAFVDSDAKVLRSIGKYHKISHRSNGIFTGTSNYITSLFNIVTGDFIDQNTLYVMGFKTYIEDTLSGKKLIHTIDLDIPSIQIHKFKDEDEIIIKETKYTVLESTLGLTGGKSKLILLNK
jgi:hypothetical protein